MKRSQSEKKKGLVPLRVLLGIAFFLIPLIALAEIPSWWSRLGITNSNPADDYAAVNQGQVKNIAVKAVAELDANLPGGAGDALISLKAKLSGTTANTNDYSAVNVGQLKCLSKPFFDRLLSVGYQAHPLESGTYPWVGKESTSNDYAMANIGQVKNLFSFDLTVTGTNGLPDWWQNFYFGGTVPDPNMLAPRGDGLTILQTYQQGVNPVDFYNGLAPYMYIVNGNKQTGTAGAFVPTPLNVCVLNGTTFERLPNTPVAFVVRQGGGGLSITRTAGSSISGTLQMLTNSYGYAQAYYQEPTGNPITSIIGVPSGKASSLVFVSYNGSTTVGEWNFDEGSGSTTAEASGSGANGTLYNTTWTTGFGAALQFDGKSSYVEVPNSSAFNIGIGPMTVMAWVRLAIGTPLVADTDFYNITYKGTGAGTGFQFALAGGTYNGLVAKVFSGGTSQQITPRSDQSAALADGNWHHVVFERDENGKATLYIDGNSIGYQTAMSGKVDASNPLWVGRGESGGYFNGAIDDVILWRTNASSDQVSSVYNSDSDSNGLADWWEIKYYGSIGQNPDALAQRGDGTTLLQAYQWGYNPLDFYDGYLPSLAIVAGGNQRGTPGAMLSVPFSVSINNGTYNAPITFAVTSGSALISATNGDVSTASASVVTRSTSLYTDSSGNTQNVGQVYIYIPNNTSDLSSITATATSGTQSVSITTTAAAYDSSLSSPTDPTATPTSSTSVDLSWTPSDSSQPTTIQASTDGGATWANIAAVAAGITSLTVTDLTPDSSVSFRAVTGNVTGTDASSAGTASISSGSSSSSIGTGGGSSSSGSATTTPLSQPVLLGEMVSTEGIKFGISGFQDNTTSYLVEDYACYSTGGSFTSTVTFDPKTGNYTKSESSTGDGEDYGDSWNISSNTSESRSGTDGSGKTSFSTNTLSNEYTSAMFHSNVESWIPPFTGNLVQGPDLASIWLSVDDSWYKISKLQYKFKVNKDPNGIVIWDVQFTPSDGSAVKHDIHSWQTNGATESPVNTVDPTQLNNKQNGTYNVILLPVDIGVDANHDGVVKLAASGTSTASQGGIPLADKQTDTTTEAKPFRFWMNDDSDPQAIGGGQEAVPAPFPDSSLVWINSQRDLEDFARLHIKIDAFAFKQQFEDGTYQLGLEWKNVKSGSPSIRIFKAYESDGGNLYLKDAAIAKKQVDLGYLNGDLCAETPIKLTKSIWTDSQAGSGSTFPNGYFIFEGVTEGKGQLVVTIWKGDQKIGEGPGVWLDIKNIKKMYQRGFAVAGNTDHPYSHTDNPPGPNVTLNNAQDPNAGQTFDQDPDETPQAIVMVHGFNTTYQQSTNAAETVFKRLYWRGYKGRFASFRWPIPDGWLNGTVPAGALGTFNDQEYIAWNSGAALKQFMDGMPQTYSRNIIAHSMGNLVTGEALREGMSVKRYALLHGATSASCYNNNSSSYPVTNTGVTTPDTDSSTAVSGLAYSKWLGSIGGQPVNFNDSQDSVVGDTWNLNNGGFKPQWFLDTTRYYYDPTNSNAGHRLGLGFLIHDNRFVTDHSETKAFINYSLTGAIGHQQNTGGSIVDSVDEVGSFGFGNKHSPGWELNAQQTGAFYWTLLFKFNCHQNYLDASHTEQ